jgi:hypothetical protein
VWDFLWFVLNPHFGWQQFRKGTIWWHNRVWIGRFPIDYWNGVGLSFVVAALPAWLLGDGWYVFTEHTVLFACMAVLTVATVALAPLYRRWHAYMRRPGSDERALVLPHRSDLSREG